MQAEVGNMKCEAVVSPSAMNKEEFSELACHCEEGEARRGNPHPLWHSDDEDFPKENGLPRQRARWLAMTFFLS